MSLGSGQPLSEQEALERFGTAQFDKPGGIQGPVRACACGNPLEADDLECDVCGEVDYAYLQGPAS